MHGLFLTDEPKSMTKYIFLMALISLIPSLVLAVAISAMGLSDQAGPDIQKMDPNTPALFIFFSFAIVSPVIETLLMSFIFFLLALFIKSRLKLAILSTIIWAILHSLISPAWGLIIWWPFFVFSCAYLTWRKQSWLKAIWVTACIHALQNLLPSIVIIMMLGN